MRMSWKNEYIEEHVSRMLELWNAYKKAYKAPLTRLFKHLGGHDVDELVKCALIMHDVGKLVPRYQKYLAGEAELEGYRHEVVSAAVTAIVFKQRPWRAYVSAAVLLSHEPILMGQVLRTRERYVTLTSAARILRLAGGKDRMSSERVLLEPDGVDAINQLLEKEGFEEKLMQEYEVEECLHALKEVVTITSLVGDRSLERIRVAALVHVLTLLDSLAASEKRGDDDGGTFISKNARLAEVVEVVRA